MTTQNVIRTFIFHFDHIIVVIQEYVILITMNIGVFIRSLETHDLRVLERERESTQVNSNTASSNIQEKNGGF